MVDTKLCECDHKKGDHERKFSKKKNEVGIYWAGKCNISNCPCKKFNFKKLIIQIIICKKCEHPKNYHEPKSEQFENKIIKRWRGKCEHVFCICPGYEGE